MILLKLMFEMKMVNEIERVVYFMNGAARLDFGFGFFCCSWCWGVGGLCSGVLGWGFGALVCIFRFFLWPCLFVC
jgi:hypothetical protein